MDMLMMQSGRGFPIFNSYMEYCSLLHKALLRWMVQFVQKQPPSFVNVRRTTVQLDVNKTDNKN